MKMLNRHEHTCDTKPVRMICLMPRDYVRFLWYTAIKKDKKRGVAYVA